MTDLSDLAARLDARLKMTEAEKIDNTGWYTSRQFAEVWGLSHRAAADRLRTAVGLGLMECQQRKMIREDGVIQSYAMYREVDPD
jgi:hypothetical protein